MSSVAVHSNVRDIPSRHFIAIRTKLNFGLQDVRARKIMVETNNSPISGSYNVSNGLTLITSNAPIDIDVSTYHTRHDHWATSLTLVTSNAYVLISKKLDSILKISPLLRTHLLNSTLDAKFSLFNKTARPFFCVYSQTSNAPLNLVIEESPVGSVVRAKGRTSNARANLLVDPVFEGTFAASTSNTDATIEQTDALDPTGDKRDRVLEINFEPDHAVASTVGWGESLNGGGLHGRSSVAKVKKSNHPVSIIV
jgi:hypothetical protein